MIGWFWTLPLDAKGQVVVWAFIAFAMARAAWRVFRDGCDARGGDDVRFPLDIRIAELRKPLGSMKFDDLWDRPDPLAEPDADTGRFGRRGTEPAVIVGPARRAARAVRQHGRSSRCLRSSSHVI